VVRCYPGYLVVYARPGPNNHQYAAQPHSMADAAPAAAPTDDKAHYETLKKELLQALPKKRAIDKQLVRVCTCRLLMLMNVQGANRGANLQPRSDVSDGDGYAEWWKYHSRV
jgi:hypothetical protein